MTDKAQQAARAADAHPAFRAMARGGYAASGLVHLLIGAIVLSVAVGRRGQTDQAGAFKVVAGAPLGQVVLWVLAVLLATLGVYHAAQMFLVREESTAKTWAKRAAAAGHAVIFIGLGFLAGSVALGSRPAGDDSAESASRDVLTLPGGPVLLGLVGAGVVIGGIVFAGMGVTRKFLDKLTLGETGRVDKAVTVLGVIGYLAKGLALATVGVLLVIAAVNTDPNAAGGLDAAVRTLLDLPFGPALVTGVGVGFAAYGIFLFFRARFAKL